MDLLDRCAQYLPAMLCVVMLAASPCPGQTAARRTYEQIVCTRFASGDAGIPAPIRQALASQPKMEVRDAQQRLWQASPKGLVEVDPSGKKKIWTGKDGLPVLSLTGIALGPDGRLWLATRQGAVCFQPGARGGEQWFYF